MKTDSIFSNAISGNRYPLYFRSRSDSGGIHDDIVGTSIDFIDKEGFPSNLIGNRLPLLQEPGL
ncbi:MAG: hypothetical protein AAGE99_02875 [Chlamydiota bacterium]